MDALLNVVESSGGAILRDRRSQEGRRKKRGLVPPLRSPLHSHLYRVCIHLDVVALDVNREKKRGGVAEKL